MGGSLRLRDCILDVLREGRPVTARYLARRLGAERVTVTDTLARLRKEGIAYQADAPRRAGTRLVYGMTDGSSAPPGGLATTATPRSVG